ncbi:MAG TPA: GAF domain-containing protein [Pseudonocardiaceae bacterium]|nr:GAF domain-containing protein [Pseudonocardiaceae bacterium]
MRANGSRSAQQEPSPEAGVDLHETLARAPLAVGITRGPDHVVELLNPAARTLLGISDAVGLDAVGLPVRTAVPTLVSSGLADLLDRVYAAGTPHHEPQRPIVLHRNGHREERVVDVTCHPLRGRDGVTRLQWYCQDLTEQLRTSRHLGFLAEAGPALLEASLEQRNALDQAAQLAIRSLGELCLINLVQPDGTLARAVVVHADPELAGIAAQLELPSLPDSLSQQVLDSGRPVVLRRLSHADLRSIAGRGQRELLDRLDLVSGLVVAIVARGRTLGTFAVCSTRPDRYTDQDVALAEGLALRAGLAMDTAELYHSERSARQLADRAAAGTAGLLRATAALSGALSPAAIAEVVVDQGTELLETSSAALYVLVPDGLELVHATGWPLETLERYRKFPLEAGKPMSDAVLQREPVWLENHEEWLARYPQSAPVHRSGGYRAFACLPLIIEGTVLGALNFSFTLPRAFSADDRNFLLTLAGQCAQALDRSRLYAAERDARALAERQRDRVAVLAEASLALDAPQSQEQRLQRLTQLVVPRIADWCAVHLLRNGKVAQIAYAHSDPEKIAFVDELMRRYPPVEDRSSGAAQVVRTGRAEMVSDISEAMLAEVARDATHLELIRTLGMTSAMIVPLTVHNRTVGALTLVSAESGQRFDSEDLAFAQDLATRAALALDNARLYEEQRDIAATLQAALLPHELPTIPGVELAGRYVAAGETNEVGGDLYDVFTSSCPGGSGPWSLVIGDVCGKGAAAAALTALIRYTVRAEASRRLPPADVLLRLNEAIIRQLTTIDARFCTAIYAQLMPTVQGLRVAMACAGHLAPRLLRCDGAIEVGMAGGTILGVYTEPKVANEDLCLAPGDTLVLVTDGVTEARGLEGFYGEDRLDSLLAGCAGRSATSVADLITDDVLQFQAGTPRDDVAVLVVQATEQVAVRAGPE